MAHDVLDEYEATRSPYHAIHAISNQLVAAAACDCNSTLLTPNTHAMQLETCIGDAAILVSAMVHDVPDSHEATRSPRHAIHTISNRLVAAAA